MKTAIVVHSLTGNTLSVVNRLKETLEEKGCAVEIEKIEPAFGEDTKETDPEKIHFQERKDLSRYDNIIMAGPVRGFSMSPVLKAYFRPINLSNRNIYLLVTHALPLEILGGKTAIGQMERLVRERGGHVRGRGIIEWGSGKRERKIYDVIRRFSDEIY